MISKKDWQYLKYIVAHKKFVFQAGLRFQVPIWRLVIHDLSKFLPIEWVPYREYFYGERTPEVEAAFERAWLHHVHLNPHHWNHYVFVDEDGQQIVQIPDHFLREMIADWYGAGRAIWGKWEAREWYAKRKASFILHPDTRAALEVYLASVEIK